MAKTYAEVARQIEALQQQADALKKKESTGVIARIREAIDFYGLTAEDLGLSSSPSRDNSNGSHSGGAASRSGAADPARAGKRASPGRKKPGKRPSSVRFRDGDGNTWTGMGRKPGWLVAGLDSGKKLDDFAVKPENGADGTAQPT